MTKKISVKNLPEGMTEMSRSELENLHSEMLATASDLGYEPPEDCCRELVESAGDNAKMLARLHAGISEFHERYPSGKPLATDEGKSDAGAGGSETKKPKKQKEKQMSSAPKKAAKKAAPKKAAKKAAPKKNGGGATSANDEKKISWLLKKEDGLGAREGSERAVRRELLRKHDGKTVAKFREAGGSVATLNRAVEEKVVKLVA